MNGRFGSGADLRMPLDGLQKCPAEAGHVLGGIHAGGIRGSADTVDFRSLSSQQLYR